METKDVLKALRKSKGFANAKDFCDVADISYNTYQNYETGKRLPTAEMLMKIAKFYGVSTDYLLGREENPDPMAQIASLTSMGVTEQVILEKYLELPKVSREIVINFMKSAIAEAEKRMKQTEQAEEKQAKPDIQRIEGQNLAVARTSDPDKLYRPAPTEEQMKSFTLCTPDMLGEDE